MQARVLTLRYSTAFGGFDDTELERLTAEHDLLELRDHALSVAGEPCLVLIATWQERTTSTEPTPVDAPRQAPEESRGNGARRPVADVLQGLDDAQRAQFDSFRAWRAATAQDEGVPPYVILTNRQLVEVVRQRPDSRAALGRIDGLGEKKLARYGDALLAQLRPAPDPADSVESTSTEENPAEARS